MAKLTARGRRQWYRLRNSAGDEYAVMSDWVVLWKHKGGTWTVCATLRKTVDSAREWVTWLETDSDYRRV